MDDTEFEISWSSADAAALLASLDSGGSNPTSPVDRSKGSARTNEAEDPHGSGCIELQRVEEASRVVTLGSISTSTNLPSVSRGRRVKAKRLDLRRSTDPYPAAPRPTRQGHYPPFEQPLPRLYPTRRNLHSGKVLAEERSEGLRTLRSAPFPLYPFPGELRVEGSEGIRTPRHEASSAPSPFLSSPADEGARLPASTDPSPTTAPGGSRRKKRTRRAGRKNQSRRLWTRLLGVQLSVEPSPRSPTPRDPPLGAGPSSTPRVNQPSLRTPRPRVHTAPRVIEDIPYLGPRITRWRLAPIHLDPVVYPCTIPPLDPRRNVYLRQRARVLYPQPGPP